MARAVPPLDAEEAVAAEARLADHELEMPRVARLAEDARARQPRALDEERGLPVLAAKRRELLDSLHGRDVEFADLA